jgi:predicted transcriptional regulator
MSKNKQQNNNIGRKLEKHFKGAANHRRINILLLLHKKEGLSLEQISENLDANYKTISEHTKKLAQAGLINKNYINTIVSHSLSPYGKKFVKFIKTF